MEEYRNTLMRIKRAPATQHKRLDKKNLPIEEIHATFKA
jgi:hypothetical protein